MYTIYADEQPLYNPLLASEGFGVISPKLSLEVNKAGSLKLTLPKNNVMYDKVEKMKSIITVYQDKEEIFRGRILNSEKDFQNRKSIYVEGQLAFLLDSPVRPYVYEGSVNKYFRQLLENHNESVDESKKFAGYYASGEFDSNDNIVRSNSKYTNTYDEINEKLIKNLGGYLDIKKIEEYNGNIFYEIVYISDYSTINPQVIEFGKNLLDIKEYIDAENIYTCLIPIGANGITISNVNNGLDYIQDDNAVAQYGKIYKVHTWDDVTQYENLLRKAKAYIRDCITLASTLTIKAVDLHHIDVNTDSIRLGDKMRVLSKPHNIDKYVMCTSMSLDLTDPSKSTYTFGNTKKTLTDKVVSK